MDKNYDVPEYNATDEDIRRIFQSSKVIAVVGLSRHHEADSYRVASYLQEHGFRIIPVRLKAKEILNEKSYASLEEVPEKIDVVNIFRKPEDVGEVVDSAIAIGAKTVWMQEGIVHNVAAAKAHEAGLTVVMDRCLMKEYKKYGIDTSL
ncbi:MAG: CoA-binding protein [Candidatus Omnitrophica bacterium]|nr:CoA-binding protein [Candidatus Omnitrophota bacterium]MCK5259680.1 CoA-binding protein [Candidatus Omnitrophota bacterium]